MSAYEQLRWKYKDLVKKQQDGSFDQQDALDLLVIMSELGGMGYILNEDETDWLPPSAEN